MGEHKLTLQEETLAAGVSAETGSRYELRLAQKGKAQMGEIHVVVRGHDGKEPAGEKPYKIRGPHNVAYDGKTGVDGAIHHAQPIPIDTYQLTILGQEFPIVSQPPTSSPIVIRVPGLGREPPKDRSFGPPPRPGGAEEGHKFIESLTARKLDQTGQGTRGIEAREELIFEELKKGNLPDFCRVWIELPVSDDRGHHGVVRVLADCLAVGSNDDYVRVNLSGYTSQRIADEWKCLLPTMKIIRESYLLAKREHKMVYHALDCQGGGRGGMWQKSNIAMIWHDDILQEIRSCKSPPPVPPDIKSKFDPQLNASMSSLHKGRCTVGQKHPMSLVVGHMKEVILSHEQDPKTGLNGGHRLSFFGFFEPDGRALQWYFQGAHRAGFTDYAQGTRLVHPIMMVDGKEMEYEAVLKSSEYYRLVINTKAHDRYPPEPDRPYTTVRYPKPVPGVQWPG